MRVESWVGVMAMFLVVFGEPSAAEQPCRRSFLPANVFLLHDIEEPLQRIYERAPSFRAQCARIAAAKGLRVTVRIDPRMPSRCRAFTIVRRSRKQIFADVHLRPSSNHAEMLAHEFEHILEQIEGLDLRTLSLVKGSGVREVEYVGVRDRARAISGSGDRGRGWPRVKDAGSGLTTARRPKVGTT